MNIKIIKMKILSSLSTIEISFNIGVDAKIEPTETVTILSKLLRSERSNAYLRYEYIK